MSAGLLLTGGASRRMGVAKADLLLGGERLAARAARVLRAVCDPVLEVGPGYSPLVAIGEDPAGGGPLVALVAGARALADHDRDSIMLLAVDLPFVEPPLLRLLDDRPPAAISAPVADGQPQPCCARFAREALVQAEQLTDAGERSLRALLAEVPVDLVPESEWRAVAPAHALDDLDTPGDVAGHGIEWPG